MAFFITQRLAISTRHVSAMRCVPEARHDPEGPELFRIEVLLAQSGQWAAAQHAVCPFEAVRHVERYADRLATDEINKQQQKQVHEAMLHAVLRK